MGVLRLILGDQLSHSIASLRDCAPDRDVILMCEVREEATYVKHHKKKIAFLFSAMRHFSAELKHKGCRVDYIKLDDEGNSGSLTGEVGRAVEQHDPEKIVVTFPGEYRVLKDIHSWADVFDAEVEVRPDDRFLCSPEAFKAWAKDRKQLRMEFFYREMRRKYAILMNDGKPEGGQWNYDADNRSPPKAGLHVPLPYNAQVDCMTREVMDLVADQFGDHFGHLEPFHLAVTRDQARYALRKFIEQRLAHFGDYQDAMIEGEPWMYHSHLSFYLNCGLLDPLETVGAAEQAYHDGRAPLNAVEGFIRQIIGWREYVRGVYWLQMPQYAQANFFNATRQLPWLYWGGETRMNCLRQCVKETEENAYAHHIQRLMVLGNFALLTGIDPQQVNEWYLLVYADAYEWVEMPNVTGMTLFADGGVVGSKPYAAGGNYINKMSNYCANCSYRAAQKNGPDACPFNYLYWDFLIRNRKKLDGNPRLSMVYRTLSTMNDAKIKAIRDDARRFLKALQESGKS
ncbi:MAG: cryptochrome/photolyase family protein [Gammaproteobacteria bacterium]|nr:cryptochrome/photolyase family protein [Gammaproteobacteria bacterium]